VPSTSAPGSFGAMSLHDVKIGRLDGTPSTLAEITGGRPALLVNVASRCGLTPQYTALVAIHERLAPRGFAVVGVPCNQFGAQEPGSADEIATFCSTSYGVSFPLTEKVEVNGPGRHPLYDGLVADGADLTWNFEKFLVDGDGEVVARFAPGEEVDVRVTAAIEALLA